MIGWWQKKILRHIKPICIIEIGESSLQQQAKRFHVEDSFIKSTSLIGLSKLLTSLSRMEPNLREILSPKKKEKCKPFKMVSSATVSICINELIS